QQILYRMRDHQGTLNLLDVWLEPRVERFLFAPLDAAYLAVECHMVDADPHQNLSAEKCDTLSRYTVFTSVAPIVQPLPEEQRVLLTTLDADLDPSILKLSNTLLADCATAREKMHRIESWFRANFRYQLGVQIPRGWDPLTYFLQMRPPAHCEYFATATAVLLRAAGVPTRYVTGYVAAEQNAFGDYWIARNRDAHAWVEAYDDKLRQWIVVESTPAAGIPGNLPTGTPDQFLDSLRQGWARMLALLMHGGPSDIARRLGRALWTVPGLIILFLAVVLLGARKLPGFPAIRIRRTERRLRPFHAVLRTLDRQAKRQQLSRPPQESLLQFADRIRHADADPVWCAKLADCYEQYAAVRFRAPTDAEPLAELQQAISRIPRRGRRGTAPDDARGTVPSSPV
ncbi:MAG: transglutaminase domain-containing protein, partial [Planctomycetaceae bacterium]|nr:transglutaminase domain-containing protein [Planctomycetaceae bacterium]